MYSCLISCIFTPPINEKFHKSHTIKTQKQNKRHNQSKIQINQYKTKNKLCGSQTKCKQTAHEIQKKKNKNKCYETPRHEYYITYYIETARSCNRTKTKNRKCQRGWRTTYTRS